MSLNLAHLTEKARADRTLRFTALAHHMTVEYLAETWHHLNRRGAAGVDRVTVAAYAAALPQRLLDLQHRLRQHTYRAPAVRRVYIPKPGQPHKQRPLGIPTIEDRLVQAGVARMLSAIYEADFRPTSYGFRPGRGAHAALRTIRNTIMTRPIRWVYEADIRGFFDHLDHAWRLRMLRLRIGDPWILRLVAKWLRAGVWDNGQLTVPEAGSPQGGPVSPILANVYLHYVLDLWVERVVQPACRGEVHLVRFADDFLVLFSHRTDADRFARDVEARLAQFGLAVAPEKTRIVPFGRWTTAPRPFDFLGFRHVCGRTRNGRYTVIRVPVAKSLEKFLARVKADLAAHQHDRPRDQQRRLTQQLQGLYQYFGLWHCYPKLKQVQRRVEWHWMRTLNRRSQRGRRAAESWRAQPWFRLPAPRLLHPTV